MNSAQHKASAREKRKPQMVCIMMFMEVVLGLLRNSKILHPLCVLSKFILHLYHVREEDAGPGPFRKRSRTRCPNQVGQDHMPPQSPAPCADWLQ